jgi:PASTA domain
VAVALRALEKQPSDRYTNAPEMAAALRHAGACLDDTVPLRAAGPPAPPPATTQIVEPPRRRRTLFAAGAAVIALLAGAAVLAGGQPGGDGADDLGVQTSTSAAQESEPPPPKVRVPKLAGLTTDAAELKLERRGLGHYERRRYAAKQEGTVLRQTPGAGQLLEEGRDILLIVSRGPRPVFVPNITGDMLADAQAVLSERELAVTTQTASFPRRTPGTVARQEPAPGSPLAPGSTVTLTVVPTPSWRQVTSVEGTDSKATEPFRIQGNKWRLQLHARHDAVRFRHLLRARRVRRRRRLLVIPLGARGDLRN